LEGDQRAAERKVARFKLEKGQGMDRQEQLLSLAFFLLSAVAQSTLKIGLTAYLVTEASA
jgi:hypothetical protein